MYQLANAYGETSAARHFLEAASITPATQANLAFVDTLTDSLRVALRGADLEPLRRAVLRAEQSGTDVHDLLAAAEYEITESMLDLGLPALHDAADAPRFDHPRRSPAVRCEPHGGTQAAFPPGRVGIAGFRCASRTTMPTP